MKPKQHDITFHYTNEEMVKDLLKLIPFEEGDVALDAGSGKNKIWQKNCPVKCLECEIEDGCDFLNDWNENIQWTIGNPPFAGNEINEKGRHPNLIPQWIEHSSNISTKGMAFLINHKIINFLTPVRLEKLKEKGFYLTKLHIVADRRWFGRYFFLIFEKKPGFVSWERKTY
jgi:hypothetical protein